MGEDTAPGSSDAVIPAPAPSPTVQQQAGNLAMQQLLRSGVIRAKLTVGRRDDPDEQEADQIAHRLTDAPAGFPESNDSCAAGGEMCEERRKSSNGLQRSASTPAPPTHVPGIVGDVLRSTGQPLDPASRAFFEPRFGQDFSHVRIHTDSKAAASARAINAQAYTVGSDVVFASRQYSPDGQTGLKLLAHELTHVSRQGRSGAEASIQRQAETLDRPSLGGGILAGPIDFSFPDQKPQGIAGPLPAGMVKEDQGLTIIQYTNQHARIEYAKSYIELSASPNGKYSYFVDPPAPRPPQPEPLFQLPGMEPKPPVQRVVRVAATSAADIQVDSFNPGEGVPELVVHVSYSGELRTAPGILGEVEEWWFTPNSVQIEVDNSAVKITSPEDDPSLRPDDYPSARFAFSLDPDWTGTAGLEKRVYIVASPGVKVLKGEPNSRRAMNYGRSLVPALIRVSHPHLVPEQGTPIRPEDFAGYSTVGYTPNLFEDDSPEKHSGALTVAQGFSGVTISQPWSGSRVSVRPIDPDIGAVFSWQVLPPSSEGPPEIRIVTGPGSFIDLAEPVPLRFHREGAPVAPPLAGTYNTGEGLEEQGVNLRIIEVYNNSDVPAPGTPLNMDFLQGRGKLREPDAHEWLGVDETALKVSDFLIRLIPVVGELYSIGEFVHALRYGENFMGQKVNSGEMVLMGAGVAIGLIPYVGAGAKAAGALAKTASALGKTAEEIEATIVTVNRLASREEQAVLSRGAKVLEEGGEISEKELPELESALGHVAPGVSLRSGVGLGEVAEISLVPQSLETLDNPQFAHEIVKEFKETGKVTAALESAVERSGAQTFEERQAVAQQFLKDAARDPALGIDSEAIEAIPKQLPETPASPSAAALDDLSRVEKLAPADRVRVLNEAMNTADVDTILTRSGKSVSELLDAVGKESSAGNRLQGLLNARAQRVAGPALVEKGLDDAAIGRIVAMPDEDKIKGQILEEVLQDEVEHTLAADPSDAARKALLRGTKTEGAPEFIAASRITDVHGDSLSDGMLGVLQEAENGDQEILMIRAFEAKAGPSRQLTSKTLRSQASRIKALSSADRAELEDEAMQILRDEKPALRTSTPEELLRTHRQELDQIMETIPQHETGQAVKTSERLGIDVSLKTEEEVPAEIMVDGTRRKVRFPGREQRPQITGVLPAGRSQGRLSKTAAKQGAKLDLMNVKGVSQSDLNLLAKKIAEAKGLPVR
jgi:Domain of unknown function (DUF4157)